MNLRKVIWSIFPLTVVIGSFLIWSSTPQPAQAQGPFANCRLGAAVVNNPITSYDFDDLNLGWYVNYSTAQAPLEPAGIEFVQTVRVHQLKYSGCRDCYTTPYTYTVYPALNTLQTHVVANPGATWFIGNEPDRRDWNGGGQDEIVPELYARAYYEISQIIRQADPTARVGIGGVVQATPLRLNYLDRVWNTYQELYGRRLGDDVDIWNTHTFILREEKNNWGAEIPAGLNDTSGWLIGPEDNDRLDLFQDQIIRLRSWLRAKGEQQKPLYITEYGINMPEYYVSSAEVKQFMTGTFDFLLNYKDSNLGYPLDAYRLVQRFIWYSLDDSKDSETRVEDYAEALFSSKTYQRTAFGNHWVAYAQSSTHQEAYQRRFNLLAALSSDPLWIYDPTDRGVFTFTLRALVVNNGNTPTTTGDNIRVDFWDGPPGAAGSHQIGPTQIIKDVPGCGDYRVAEVTWPNRPPGVNVWYARIKSIPGEAVTSDNVASAHAFVASSIVYLPHISKGN